MATYTSNLNLKKPALDDDALITDINNNMDILDAAANGIQDALAIVATGNTHAAITSGQFVYVRNHNTLTEGLYVASSNIAANATLSSSNLAADSKGGLNALSEQMANLAPKGSMRLSNNNSVMFTFSSYSTSAIIFAASANNNGALYVYSNGYLAPIKTASDITFTLSSDYKTITVSNTTGAPIHVGCISADLMPIVS